MKNHLYFRRITASGIVGISAFIGFFGMTSTVSATTVTASLVRTIDTSAFLPPSPDPDGLVFLPSGEFLIADSEVDEMPLYAGANIYKMNQQGALVETSNTLCFSHEPTGISYNPNNGHYFMSDDDMKVINEIDPGADKQPCTADDGAHTFFSMPALDNEDVVYDSVDNVLYITDGGAMPRIVKVAPGPNGKFDGTDDVKTSFSVAGLGMKTVEGIAIDPVGRDLFLVGNTNNIMVEMTRSGTYVRTYDISASHAVVPAGLTFGPSSVDPSKWNIYIVARGLDNDPVPSENDGKLYEMQLSPYSSSVDTIAPNVSVASPANGALVSGSSVFVTATASDNVGVTSVSFNLDGTVMSTDTVAPYEMVWSTLSVTNGSHTLTVTARDAAGNAKTSVGVVVTVNNTVVSDTEAPTVPTNLSASAFSSNQINLAWNASTDNVGVAGYTIFQNGTQIGTVNGTAYSSVGLVASTTYTYTVSAYDIAGNTSAQSLSATATTSSMSATSTVIFIPTADTSIKSATPTVNYGNDTSFVIDNSPKEASLLQFTITGVGTGAVTNAKLRLYNVNPSKKGGSFYVVSDNNWSESGVNWNNAPLFGTTPFSTLGAVASGRWYEINLSSFVTGDGTYSIRIVGNSPDKAGYASKEASVNKPQLVVAVSQ